MFDAFERLMAWRYLRARRREGFISVIAWFSFLGIALGVATLIIVMAVMNGFRQELFDRILGLEGHIEARAPGGEPVSDYAPLARQIAGVAGVTRVLPVVEGQVMASREGRSAGVRVRGLSRSAMAEGTAIGANLRFGSLAAAFRGDEPGVLMGYDLARRLGVAVGDRVTLLSATGETTAFGSMPRRVGFRVAGLVDLGMHQYDNNYIYMPLGVAQRFFRTGDGVSFLQIDLADPDATRAARERVQAAIDTNLRLLGWQRRHASFVNALKVERNVMFVILTLIILVAAFNIVSSMIMLVKDKGRDIAILRTMGASRGAIMRIFFLTGTAIGTIGTALGFVAGTAFAANIEAIRQALQNLLGTKLFASEVYFLAELPAKLAPVEVGSVVVMALVLTVLATLYPAWRAARLDPVEGLRYA